LLDKTLVFFVKHANITLKTISFTFHISVNFCPFVLLLACNSIFFNQELSHLVILASKLTFFVFKVRSESSVLRLKCFDDLIRLSIASRHGEISDLIAKHLVLLLDSFVLSAVDGFIVSFTSAISSVEALAKTLNGIVLGFEFASVVCNQVVSFVLESVILSLNIHQLSLELLNSVIASCKRLRKVTSDAGTAFERRSKRRVASSTSSSGLFNSFVDHVSLGLPVCLALFSSLLII